MRVRITPSCYAPGTPGTHAGYEFLIQPERCFDPSKYFVICANLFANGLSSSPGNTPKPFAGSHFPTVTIRDNVRAQHLLVTKQFGVEKLVMVAGFSMGAQQTFQWGVSYPEMVARLVPWCGAARTSPHTHVFIEGFSAALRADAAWNNGDYREQPERGLRAKARVYAGWGFSQDWYRQELFKEIGYSSVEDFLVAFWENFFCNAMRTTFSLRRKRGKVTTSGLRRDSMGIGRKPSPPSKQKRWSCRVRQIFIFRSLITPRKWPACRMRC
jgi:homoserine acetyltransferase